MKQLFTLICVLLIFTACEKPPTHEEVELPPAQEGGIFMLNEGTYNGGNASLTFYDFKENTITDDVFYVANNRHLGDVLQSMTMHNGLVYLVVNNSKKIEIIDATSFKSQGTITGFNSPRYMLFVNDAKAYVSDLYDNAIAVVDVANKSISTKINCPGATEQMLMQNGKVYVCNTKKNYVYIINSVTDILEDSIALSYGSNSLVLDRNNKIWVLCSGDKDNNINAGLHRINPLSNEVELSINNIAPTGIFGATRLTINGGKNVLYWLNTNVCSINITDTLLPAQPFISAFNNKFYGLGANPVTGELYVSDAVDFVQKAIVTKYSSSGEYKGAFRTSPVTNSFYFYYK